MKSQTFRRILVVEDDLALLDELKDLFESEFEVVVPASDGGEAYIRSLNEEFDLIFSDIKMPGMTGLELVTRLRSEGKTTPIILASSAADREHLIQALRLGITDFIEKPYTPDMLREILYRNLEIIRRERSMMAVQDQSGSNSPVALQQRKVLGLLKVVHSTAAKKVY